MGIRGELFSTKVQLQNRTYFFNVKENRTGDLYLNIVESKNRESGGFERQSVVLFAEDLQEFLSGFDESLRILEKAFREKKRSNASSPRFERGRYEKPRADNPSERGKPFMAKKGEHSSKPKGNDREPDRRKPRSVKVVRRKD